MEARDIEFTEAFRQRILDAVAQTVQTRLFDPRFNGRNWPALVRQHTEAIVRNSDQGGFEAGIETLLQELAVRPVAFSHQTRARVPVHHVLRATLYAHEGQWMFQDVQEDGAAHVSGIRPGDQLLAINGESLVPPSPITFRAGVPASLTVQRRDGRVESITPEAPSPAVARAQNVQTRVLDDGIGYLKITRFPGLVGIDAAHDIGAAVRQLAECRSLILDLRGNPGGGSANLRLMSYLTGKKQPVGYSLTRRRAERGYRREDLPRFRRIPDSKLPLLWLALRFKFVDKSIVVVTEGLKPPRFQGRVVMLVNEHTASGSEIVAGFAKDHQLAVLIGTRTAGHLYGWSSLLILDGYRLTIPVSNYLTWEGKCFEGAGIEPDIEEPFSPLAAMESRDRQLEVAVATAKSL